jgi:hypothetical protein
MRHKDIMLHRKIMVLQQVEFIKGGDLALLLSMAVTTTP